jgi:sensor histidine kinase YesM
VELEKLRLGERLEISFQATGEVQQATIAPLLLFPLLENCFKHGSHRTSEKIWVRFQLHAAANGLEVQIENSLPEEENLLLPHQGWHWRELIPSHSMLSRTCNAKP